MAKAKHLSPHAELIRALDISEHDQELNKSGYVTTHQCRTIPRREHQYWSEYLLPFIFMFLMMALLSGWNNDDTFNAFAFWLVLSVPSIPVIGFAIYRWRILAMDLRSNAIKRIEGVVVVPEGSKYTLEINGHNLWANRKILDRIRHLETYTIDYLERSKVILSMQPIDAEDNLREGRLVDEVDVYDVDAKQKRKHNDYR